MTVRVLHVLDSLARGGVETTFLHVLRAWQGASDLEHHVVALGDGPLRDDYAAAARRLTVASTRAAIDEALDGNYDVVHLLADRAAHRLMPRLVAHGDAAIVMGKNYDVAALQRINGGRRCSWDEAAIEAADAATFTTPELAAAYAPAGRRGMSLRKVADVARFSAIGPPAPDTPNRVLCVANLHPRKRLSDLAPMLAYVRATVPDVELRIAGAGSADEREAILAAARQHSVADLITLLGPVADIAPALERSRLLVLPSGSEGVPTVLLEAMAASRPVVTARSGHVDHVVSHGKEGFVVAPGDVEGLAAGVRRLLTDRALAARLGAAAHQRALHHDVRVVASKIALLLRSAAHSRLRRTA
jgi:glycosyltransferase involved in cell wall biosynthesis